MMIKGKNYSITAENIKGHEIIGLDVLVKKSSDVSREGIMGKVVDETKNTLVIEGKHSSSNGGVKVKKFIIPKKECDFEFDLNGEKVVVKGIEIMRRPEERAKEWRGSNG